MKATVFKEHGSVDRLVYTDCAEPEISSYEVLVKVKACGINHLDIWKKSMSCLKGGGRIVTCGATSGPTAAWI